MLGQLDCCNPLVLTDQLLLSLGVVQPVLDSLREVGIGLKALGSNPRKSAKAGTGEKDVTVSFGGARFVPGRWIYCDEDGVVVSPRRLHPSL